MRAVDDLVETRAELVDGINDTVNGVEFASIEVGEDFAGSKSIGSAESEISDIGFKTEGIGKEIES